MDNGPNNDGLGTDGADNKDADLDCTGYIVVQSFIDFGNYDPSASEDGAGPNTCSNGIDDGNLGGTDRTDPDCVVLDLTYSADKQVGAAQQLDAAKDCRALALGGGDPASVGLVAHACTDGSIIAPVRDDYVGRFVTMALNCSDAPSVTEIKLLPAVPFFFESGAGFGQQEFPGPSHPFLGAGFITVFPASDAVTINCVEPPAPTATPTAMPFPALQKSPALQNLFLTRQGDKIPPVQCVGPQGSSDVALLTQSLNQPITTLDPKGSGQPQQLGAFEFEVHYDATKVCVELQTGPAAANMTCFVEDSVTKPVLEGIARIGCVTIGKTGFPDTSTPEGRRLADVLVRPQPDVYSQAIPNQGNGVVVQLLNQACELADLQGHPIALFSCEDADVTIRYLEGDVEPDCVVNTLDTQAIAFRWGASKGDLLFLDRFNLEPFGAQSDDDVDIKDLQAVYGRIGSTCAAPHPEQPPVNPKG